jgi:Holliday junction resolvase RusA-like endonuclease
VIALRPTDDFPVLAARLVVYGDATTQGSKSAFCPPHPFKPSKNGKCVGGRAVMREGASNDAYARWQAWRHRIEIEALLDARKYKREPIDAACAVTATFYLRRPKSVKARYPHKALDLDKLARTAFDGITGTLLTNDARVVDELVFKRYADGHPPCLVLGVFVQ